MTGKLAVQALALLAAAATTACPRPARSPALDECCARRTVRIDPSFTDDEAQAVRAAIVAWREATGGRACFLETEDNEFALAIVRGGSKLALRPFDRFWQDHHGLRRPGLVIIVVEGASFQTIRGIAAHELGHDLDLEHDDASDVEPTIMHSVKGEIEGGHLSGRDRRAFDDAHPECR